MARRNPSRPSIKAFNKAARVVRLWLLIPKKDVYVPGFEGNFYEAYAAAKKRAVYNRTTYEVWEADPRYYRAEGGLKKLWAIARP